MGILEEIFPELAESKDEKTRKEIIRFIRMEVEDEIVGNKWLAWLENVPVTIDHEKREGFHLGYKACLEKQGEKKFEMKSAEESLGIDSDTYNKIVDECIFGEQKPTDTYCHCQETGKCFADGDCKANWSEEDEIKINRIVACLENLNVADNDILLKDIDWLKSLKGRVQSQPKQEWSEEDKKIINGLIDSLTRISLNTRTDSTSPNYTFYKEIDWLKSLRPQNRWKPSSEQIDLLQAIINEPKNAASESCQIVLREVLEQLKKLKGEV